MSLLKTITMLAPHHKALTTELEQMDDLASTLVGVEADVSRLRTTLINEEIELPRLRANLIKEFREQISSQMSVGSKLREKLGGPSSLTSDEDKMKSYPEWASALAKLEQRKDEQPVLARDLELVSRDADDLRMRIARRDQIFSDLDAMYKLVFEGRTPEAPDEDLLEWQLRSAEKHVAHMGMADIPETLLLHLDAAIAPARELEKKLRSVKENVETNKDVSLLLSDVQYRNVAISRFLAPIVQSHVEIINKYLRQRFTTEASTVFNTTSENLLRDSPLTFMEIPRIDMLRTYGVGGNFTYTHNYPSPGSTSTAGGKEGIKEAKLDYQLPSNGTIGHLTKFADAALRTLRALEYEHTRARERVTRVQNEVIQAKSAVTTLTLQLHSLRRRLFERIAEQAAGINLDNAPREAAAEALVGLSLEPRAVPDELPPQYGVA
ncbi:hypothetical protein BKA62DRAFT_691942 [Auriculariales sp. MPI-PUGE-AT-0066]|nr:hypothetical protein BKA62DRAFT_691942 [Auriculariales sp. MPI-PUGE-AT-0066]